MLNMQNLNLLSRRSFSRAFVLALIGLMSLMNNSSLAITHAASSAGIAREELHAPVNVTPPFTLTRGQTAHLNFLNAGSRPLEIAPCFLDAAGRHIRMTERPMIIAPGNTRIYDLSYAEAGPPEAGPPEAGPPEAGPPERTVRGAVHADSNALGQLVVSAEVINDVTGKTDLFVPGESALRKKGDTQDARKQGGKDNLTASGDVVMRKAGGDAAAAEDGGEVTQSLAPVGITFGQKLRLMVLNAGGRPMELSPCFLDADGEHIVAMGAKITLAPGQTRWIEISRTDISSRNGLRALVRGAVHVGKPDSPYLIAAGVIIDQLTGVGSLYVPPAAPVGVDTQAGPPEKN